MGLFIILLLAIVLLCAVSAKLFVAFVFLASCTALCLFVNHKFRIDSQSIKRKYSNPAEPSIEPSYDGNHDIITMY